MSDREQPTAGPTRAKIVATIGPASDTAPRIDALLAAGMSVARLNCAHGTEESLRRSIALLRERAARADRPLAILADLAGPKLRIGRFRAGPIELRRGEEFALTTDGAPGDARSVSVDYPGLAGEVAPGMAIFLNDGLIRLTVTAVGGGTIRTRVDVGGELGDRKGIAVPAIPLRLPAVTDADRRALAVVLSAGVDFVGLSFVRSPADVDQLRAVIADHGAGTPIVAKIEKAQAIESLEDVVARADAVMVARGDLGVEFPPEHVPILQKRIIEVCRRSGVPVITATQMLESMERSPVPTRAEATDVANAVLDGSDALMLSGETAMGRYPVEAVQTMRRIIAEAERYAARARRADAPAADRLASCPSAADALPASSITDATSNGACRAAESAGATAIAALTRTGTTARALARWRPRQPIYAVTEEEGARRRLALVWGVEPLVVPGLGEDFDTAAAAVVAALRERARLPAGARVVLTGGLPFGRAPQTNTLRIEKV